jgi:hypothetical protein
MLVYQQKNIKEPLKIVFIKIVFIKISRILYFRVFRVKKIFEITFRLFYMFRILKKNILKTCMV